MSDKFVKSSSPGPSCADPSVRSNPALESPEERQASIAKLREMSRDDRLALLMRNFSVECAEVGGRPRRGSAAPRKAPACALEGAQESRHSSNAPDAEARPDQRRRTGA